MAVTFVIGGVHRITSIFSPGINIPATLANEFAEAEPGLHASSLFYLALILFALSFFMISFAKFYFLAKIREKSKK